jgi:hypothetical protein
MTTVSDSGLERIGDLIRVDAEFLAVGSGQNESSTASGLGSREFAASTSSSNVEFVETGTTGEFEAIIRIKGGTEVSAGTTISEVGLFDGEPVGSGTLLVIDEFDGVTVEAGHTEEFTVPIDPRRV